MRPVPGKCLECSAGVGILAALAVKEPVILPNQYLKVNTIFNVAHNHGMLTAWSDKHPAYQVLAGPSGTGVADLFTPEINSQAIGFPVGRGDGVRRVQGTGCAERDRRLQHRDHHLG